MIIINVYLINNIEDFTFHFPVNPIGNIQIKRDKKIKTIEILNKGEYDLSEEGENIIEFSFNTIFPKKYESYCSRTNIPSPVDIIEMLTRWKNQDKPLRLIITDFNFNSLVYLSSISEEERAGEIDDKYCSLTFRTYRPLEIEYIGQNNSTYNYDYTDATLNNRNDVESTGTYYTTTVTDCLWNIAKRYYGDGSKWQDIYNANKTIIGSNPNIIHSGQNLYLP